MGTRRTHGLFGHDEEAWRDDDHLLDSLAKAMASGCKEDVESAFEAIYRRHAKTVAFICARYLGDDADIVSVTDDVFVRFFRQVPSLTEPLNLRAYLAAMARHAAIDRARANMRRERGLCTSAATLPADSSFADRSDRSAVASADPLDALPDPDADIGASVRYRELLRDLACVLCARDVDIILSHVVYGQTFGEIGTRLEIKENTVRTMYHRALKTFRKEKGESWL